jgi:hypothetical protein
MSETLSVPSAGGMKHMPTVTTKDGLEIYYKD